MNWLVRNQEPPELVIVRDKELDYLRNLKGGIKSDDIKGYRIVSNVLWKSQYFKCCYCEAKIPESYNDVEHYRPKAEADRLPGCASKHGYWWLAFTWANLLYACPGCNRTGKGILFPLDSGSSGAIAEAKTFKTETPLFIDPYELCYIQYIQYRFIRNADGGRWYARPRKRSKCSSYTIRIAKLNRSELLELRQDHFEVNIQPQLLEFDEALQSGRQEEILACQRRLSRLFGRRALFASFSYDVITQAYPNFVLEKFGCRWPDVVNLWIP